MVAAAGRAPKQRTARKTTTRGTDRTLDRGRGADQCSSPRSDVRSAGDRAPARTDCGRREAMGLGVALAGRVMTEDPDVRPPMPIG